jgi:tetratricopeptide (TPR) repeat protein
LVNFGLTVLGKYDEALDAFNKSIELEPGNSIAWNNKATVLFAQGERNEALYAFKKSVKLQSSYDIMQVTLYTQNRSSIYLKLLRVAAMNHNF